MSYLTEMVYAGFGRALFHPNFDENQKLDYDLFYNLYQNNYNIQFSINLNYDKLMNLVPLCDYNLRKFVFSSLITSSELLEEIYDKIEDFSSFGREVLSWIFENPCASFDLRLKIASDYHYPDAVLIENSICSEDFLAKCWDDSEELRDLILHNTNCPINILLDLLDKGYSAFFKKRQELMKLIINNNHFTSRILLDNWDYFIQEVGDDDFKNFLNSTIAYLLTRNSKDESLTDEDVCKLYMFYNRRIKKVELILGRCQKEEELKAKLKVGINSFFGSTDCNNTANIDQSTPSDVDIEKDKNKVNKDNEKTQVVNEKLRLISKLIPFYYGERKLLDEACNLVDEYNRKVKQIHEEKKEIVLSFENDKNAQPSVSDLYSSLIDDLDSILKMLDECKIKYQKYEDILGYIDKIFKVLCSNQVCFDDLSNDIFLIKTKVLPFVDDDSFLEELKQIFESEKKYIVDYFKGNIDKLDYDSLNEFKVHIRNKLMIYLMRLDVSIKDKYDINKIKLKFLNDCLNIVADDREKYNIDWLREIRGIINNIKLYGNDVEKNRLKEILKNVKYVDKHNIWPSLLLLFRNLYGLNLDIESRKSDFIIVDRPEIKEGVSRQTK